jgi:hypothetical protein
VVNKFLLKVAVTSKVDGGNAELGCVWLLSKDFSGDSTTREEPYLDGGVGPLHSIHAASVRIEASTVRIDCRSSSIASRRPGGTAESAVVLVLRSRLAHPVHLTDCVSTEVKSISIGYVDAGDNVDFTYVEMSIKRLQRNWGGLLLSEPRDQNIGQVPQMPPGMCLMSTMKRPWLYDFFVSIRTLPRPIVPRASRGVV